MENPKPIRIFVSALELSADYYGYSFLKALKKVSSLEIYGMASFRIQSLTKNVLLDFSSLSTIGFYNGIATTIQILKNLFLILKNLFSIQPDYILLIDAPLFNFFFLRILKFFFNIPCIYLFPPSPLSTRNKSIKKMISKIDLIIVCFYNDYLFYSSLSEKKNKVFYMQHPFSDIIQVKKNSRFKKDTSSFQILFLPGSRIQEIQNHLPLFIELLNDFELKSMKIHWGIVLAKDSYKEKFKTLFSKILNKNNVSLFKAGAYEKFSHFDFAFVSSGTVSLEIALLEIPMVIFYKLDPLSYLLLKKKLNQIQFIGLPNILLKKKWIPEYIQEKACLSSFKKEIFKNINKTKNQYKKDLNKMRKALFSHPKKMKNFVFLLREIKKQSLKGKKSF